MINKKDEIRRICQEAKRSKDPLAVISIALADALGRLDQCDDEKRALETLCARLINKFCAKGTRKSELLRPIMEEIKQTKKELEVS